MGRYFHTCTDARPLYRSSPCRAYLQHCHSKSSGAYHHRIHFQFDSLLNKIAEGIDFSPLFVVIVTFCFSMTVGVLWKFFENYADRLKGLEMQKDRVVQVINSVNIGAENGDVHHVGDIERTIIES